MDLLPIKWTNYVKCTPPKASSLFPTQLWKTPFPESVPNIIEKMTVAESTMYTKWAGSSNIFLFHELSCPPPQTVRAHLLIPFIPQTIRPSHSAKYGAVDRGKQGCPTGHHPGMVNAFICSYISNGEFRRRGARYGFHRLDRTL